MSGNVQPAERVCAALRSELTAAIKRRDTNAVVALRTTIAAIENAQAVDPVAPAFAGHEAGPSERPRRELSETQVSAIVRAQIKEREQESKRYDALGETSAARRLRVEADALSMVWNSIERR
jgi:uncharacterized protein